MLIHSLEKSHLNTNTFVFGTSPLNNTTPDRPGRKSSLIHGSSQTSTINFSNSPMVGHNIGQNDADGQYGATSVPTAEHAWAWRITLGIRLMGGHHQLFSPAQLTVNVSTASEPGFQQRLLTH